MMLFRALILLLQGGMSYKKIEGFIQAFIDAARIALFGGGASATAGLLHSEFFTILAIIAVAFLIITFYSDLIKEASNDTLTSDKFVAAIIKLFIGAMTILFLPEILNVIFGLVETLFKASTGLMQWLSPGASDTSSTINRVVINITQHNKNDGLHDATLGFDLQWATGLKIKAMYDYSSIGGLITMITSGKDQFEWSPDALVAGKTFGDLFEGYYGPLAIFRDMWTWVMSIVVLVVSLITMLGTYFAIAKAVIEFTIFTFVAPVGIINLMGDERRMIGIKYLKKLLAKGLTLVTMIVLLAVCSNICSGMIFSAINNARDDGLANYENMVTNPETGAIEPSSTPVNPLVNKGVLTLTISDSQNDLDAIFSGGVITKCLIMQIAQVGLLLGAAKLTDEIFAT